MESVNSDRAAGYYDATRALPDAAMNSLADLLASELHERQPCLEIGVGTGRFALPLRGRGIVTAGADISGAMLRQLVVNAGSDQAMPRFWRTRPHTAEQASAVAVAVAADA